jgi:uncharacterized membrane protein YdjX (TVP38/TMEM64 family)
LTSRTLLFLAVLAALAGGFIMLERMVDLSELVKTDRLVALLQAAGPFGPFLLIGGMATAVVVSPIPSLPLDLAAGAAYGPAWGTFYAVLGAEIGAILSFLIARAVGREWLQKVLRLDVRFCELCSDRHLVTVLVLARLLPIVSFDVISYGAGLTNMSVITFALATLVGMVPPTLAFTYFGSSVVSAQWPLVLAGGLMVAFFLLVPKLVLRYPRAWWARLFLGASPQPAPVPAQPALQASAEPSFPRCSGCGKVMN